MSESREQRTEKLRLAIEEQMKGLEPVKKKLDDLMWDTLVLYAGEGFETAKKLRFTFFVKGNEMFVSRKEKSLTKATVILSFHRALELRRQFGTVTGPKKLGTFGASYLYPIFLKLGIIENGKERENE